MPGTRKYQERMPKCLKENPGSSLVSGYLGLSPSSCPSRLWGLGHATDALSVLPLWNGPVKRPAWLDYWARWKRCHMGCAYSVASTGHKTVWPFKNTTFCLRFPIVLRRPHNWSYFITWFSLALNLTHFWFRGREGWWVVLFLVWRREKEFSLKEMWPLCSEMTLGKWFNLGPTLMVPSEEWGPWRDHEVPFKH